jgi:hypothetical protein
LLQERVLEVGAIDMMRVLDLIDDGGERASASAVFGIKVNTRHIRA